MCRCAAARKPPVVADGLGTPIVGCGAWFGRGSRAGCGWGPLVHRPAALPQLAMTATSPATVGTTASSMKAGRKHVPSGRTASTPRRRAPARSAAADSARRSSASRVSCSASLAPDAALRCTTSASRGSAAVSSVGRPNRRGGISRSGSSAWSRVAPSRSARPAEASRRPRSCPLASRSANAVAPDRAGTAGDRAPPTASSAAASGLPARSAAAMRSAARAVASGLGVTGRAVADGRRHRDLARPAGSRALARTAMRRREAPGGVPATTTAAAAAPATRTATTR